MKYCGAFEHRKDLNLCFENIQDSGDFDPNTVREAGALAMLLEDQDFKFFLELYHHIMPHVDFLYAKLQKKNIDSVHIKESIQQFQQRLYKDTFPEDALSSTMKAYPMLSGSKLKTELSLIYSKEEVKACRGAVDLFQLFMENNLDARYDRKFISHFTSRTINER